MSEELDAGDEPVWYRLGFVLTVLLTCLFFIEGDFNDTGAVDFRGAEKEAKAHSVGRAQGLRLFSPGCADQ